MKSTQYSSKRGFLTSGLLLLAAIMLLACAQSTFAQWASPSPNPNNNIYYNSGNVGIGTTGPSQKLQIGDNSVAALGFRIAATGVNWDQLTDASGNLTIGNGNGNGNGTYMTFLKTPANVGIGTTTPTY